GKSTNKLAKNIIFVSKLSGRSTAEWTTTKATKSVIDSECTCQLLFCLSERVFLRKFDPISPTHSLLSVHSIHNNPLLGLQRSGDLIEFSQNLIISLDNKNMLICIIYIVYL